MPDTNYKNPGSTPESCPSLSLAVPLLALQRPRPPLRVRQLEQWAAQLPIGNHTLAGQQFLDKLRLLNRSQYSPRERLQLHNCLRPTLDELLRAIRLPLRQAGTPLDRKQHALADLLQQLLEQMANGYKLLVAELAMSNPHRETGRMLLEEAAYLAGVYLSQRLIEAYSLYATEPRQVWANLNQLYLYAEAKQFLYQEVDDPLPDTRLPMRASLDQVYKRTILLAMAEPYHLMRHEAADLFRLTANFVEGCAIEAFDQLVTRNEFIIDLDADRGPYFVDQDNPSPPVIPRLIDIRRVRTQLDTQLQHLLRSNLHNAQVEVISLVERQQRDMLLRLADAWNASLQRKAKRFSLEAPVELSAGLNASHYFISQRARFTPEIDALRLAQGLDRIDDSKHTVFASAYREALQKDRRHNHQGYQLNPWWQSDISPIGIALNAEDVDQQLDVSVGELVVYRFSGKRLRRWQVGVIRWLRTSYETETASKVNIGIMNLARGAVPVGIKALKGQGSGTDYFRGILIPHQISLQQTRSLIAPALLYDVGTVLVMNLKQRLSHVRLTRVLISTSSFCQFEFEIVERPDDFIF